MNKEIKRGWVWSDYFVLLSPLRSVTFILVHKSACDYCYHPLRWPGQPAGPRKSPDSWLLLAYYSVVILLTQYSEWQSPWVVGVHLLVSTATALFLTRVGLPALHVIFIRKSALEAKLLASHPLHKTAKTLLENLHLHQLLKTELKTPMALLTRPPDQLLQMPKALVIS